MRVKMIQQLSGNRGDGMPWPGPGQEFDSSGEEFEWLTHAADGSSSPIAVPVTETRASDKAEVRPAPDDPKTETREEKPAANDPPWDDDEPGDKDDVPPAKRGPGRPRKDSLPK